MNFEENAIPNSYWVIPDQFMAGPYPSAIRDSEAHLKAGWLIQNGFSFFLDLTEPGEYGLEPYAPLLLLMTAENEDTVTHKRISIRDLDTPPGKKWSRFWILSMRHWKVGIKSTCTATAESDAREL